MQNLTQGRLEITIVEAKLTRDTEIIGSMDPYVKATWEQEGEEKEHKSVALEGAGKTPNWESEPGSRFDVEVTNVHDFITFKVKDQNVVESDCIG